MTTYYVDLVGGSDANNGTSFALRKKTIASLGAATIGPGDVIRIMASPPPTSLGINGTWTDGPKGVAYNIVSSTNATPIVVRISTADYTAMAPQVGDTVGLFGHSTNTNANGIWKISAVDGVDDITIVNADGTNSVGNGAGGASGNLRKITSCVVTLASALTKNVALCGNRNVKTNWTASANVTCTVTTANWKEGGEAQQIAIAAGFTTGLAAYFATGTLDLSAYQQLSFWFNQTAGTVAVAGDYKLQLCTDAVGAVAVHDIAIPAASTNGWRRVTVDLGANMNAAIASINLTVNVDRGAVTFILDNIIACKASGSDDALTLQSLIGKNTGAETWCAIQSINDKRVVLDKHPGCLPTAQWGYAGTTETVTAYKRETIKTDPAAGNTFVPQDNGSAGNLITYSGGWNRTDMSTQTDETWTDGQVGAANNNGWVFNNRTFVKLEKVGLVNYDRGIDVSNSANDNEFSEFHANNCTASGLQSRGGLRNTYTIRSCSYTNATGFELLCFAETGSTASYKSNIPRVDHVDGNETSGINISSSSANSKNLIIGDIGSACCNNQPGLNLVGSAHMLVGTISRVSGNNSTGLSLIRSHYSYVKAVLEANRNSLEGVAATAACELFIGKLAAANNGTRSITMGSTQTSACTTLFVREATLSDATQVGGFTGRGFERCFIEKLAGVTDSHKVFWDTGTIEAQTAVRHTASGIAWKFSPTSTDCDIFYPLELSLAKIAVAANKQVTVKVWIQRSSTSITAILKARGAQIAGVAADVSVVASGGAAAWQQETISFTPTEAGVVEIIGEVYGGTTLSAYYDDLTAQQGGRVLRSTLNIAHHGQPFAPVSPMIAGSFFLTFP